MCKYSTDKSEYVSIQQKYLNIYSSMYIIKLCMCASSYAYAQATIAILRFALHACSIVCMRDSYIFLMHD